MLGINGTENRGKIAGFMQMSNATDFKLCRSFPLLFNVYLSAPRRLAREGAASGLLSQEQAAANRPGAPKASYAAAWY